MKYIFSFLERKSFVKIFFICLLSLILLTGFTYSLEEDNGSIHIFPPKRVSLIYADERIDLLTYEENVKEILNSYSIEYSEKDIILPSLDYLIKDKGTIRVILVEQDFYEEIIEIPFETKRMEDSNLKLGEEVIEQKGVLGIKKTTHREVYENGQLVEIKIYKEEIVAEPTTQIIKFGTKTSAMGGRNCPHWDKIIDKSTEDEREREILKSLIRCESNCSDAKNNNNRYLGLLQFSPNTFYHYGGEDIWNGEQQILAAINILKAGGLSHHWPGCSRNVD